MTIKGNENPSNLNIYFKMSQLLAARKTKNREHKAEEQPLPIIKIILKDDYRMRTKGRNGRGYFYPN